MSKISLFPEGKLNKEGKMAPATVPFTALEFDDYLQQVKDGEFQDEVLQFRASKIEKTKLRGVTASGTFTYRNANNLNQHSGFIAIDIDAKDNPDKDLNSVKEKFKSDPYIYSFHHSAGGYGICSYVKIAAEKHLDSFLSLEKYFADNYELIIDQSCKDVARFRFVSYDPDLFINKKSKTWKNYLKKVNVQPARTYVHSGLDIDFIFQQISDTGIDLTDSYSDWLKVGFAFASKYGETGRQYFHHVSVNSHKYDTKVCDKLYDIILRRKNTGITINTFFWLCAQKGLEIKTPRTEQIERIGKMRRKADTTGTPQQAIESAKKYLKEMENISGTDVDEVLNIVKDLPLKEINEKSDDLIADLKIFLDSHNILFNEITRNYEINSEPLTDRLLNTLYIKSLEQVDNKLQKDKVFTLIDSDYTKAYHPFIQFFEKYKHLKPTGNFEKLCACIQYRQVYVDENDKEFHYNNYLETFLKKWLLGIISSMHGTYSLLVLVMTGGQGTGKTKFFRGLLPDDLQPYYAESKLDEGKDSEILMTKKLIVMDDEFGGKSKQDAKRLKELSSKQWFSVRKPFGRVSEDLRRLAVLCGTSNEGEIINDPTGNRRIIPVNLIDIDIEAFEDINKVDLFIELYHEWRENGDKWMLTKDDIANLNRSTSANEQPVQEYEIVSNFFRKSDSEGGNSVYLTNTDIKNVIEEKTQIKINSYKLGLALKQLGFEKKSKKVAGVAKIVYLCEMLNGLKIS